MEINEIAVETPKSAAHLDFETRTMSAKYAVEKAREIVKKNAMTEQMVNYLMKTIIIMN